MDKEAIDTLLALGAQKLDKLDMTHYPAALIPSESELVSLERFGRLPHRQRARVSFTRIDDFSKYVNAESDELTVVMIEPDGSGAVAGIDFGSKDNPGWKEHEAKLKLPTTPEWDAIRALCSQSQDQRELVDWIEDWDDMCVLHGTDGEQINSGVAIGSIRSVTLESISKVTAEDADYEASLSTLDRIAAKSEKGQLPAVIKARCRIYECLDEVDVMIRVRILTGRQKPAFQCRISARERLLDDAAKQVEAKLRAGCAVDRIYVGNA